MRYGCCSFVRAQIGDEACLVTEFVLKMKMFETLYLHIGIEKTGKTSIQKSLDQNRDALLELGLSLIHI